jgi:putative transferase (TIGR04331 family)
MSIYDRHKLHLITSADLKTWKLDQPVVFLGKFCNFQNRKNILDKIDYVVVPPYGLKNKLKDQNEVRILEKKFFSAFYTILNEHHKKNYNERSWKIILGHWFRRYVQVILNRVKTLEQCFALYNIKSTTVYNNNKFSLAPLDSQSAIQKFNDDRWNIYLTSNILSFFKKKSFLIYLKDEKKNLKTALLKKTSKEVSLKNIFLIIYNCYKKISKYLIKDNDALIIVPYLPLKNFIKLELSLRQFPQINFKSKTFSTKEKVCKELRKKLKENLLEKFDKKFESQLEYILINLIFECLPICYLEGFKDLHNLTKSFSFPKKPKFIFTSNAFDCDEHFKLWCANRVEEGTKYFVGQHGNNYLTNRFTGITIEEETCDHFIHWGSKRKSSKYVSAFIFKTPTENFQNYDKAGNLLLIQLGLTNRLETWDVFEEYEIFFNQQIAFIKALSNEIFNKLILRLFYSNELQNISEIKKFKKFFANIKIDDGKIQINKLIEKSRLVIHSYDSTGLLETLSQNIPTLAFWQNKFDHINSTERFYYKLLVDAGILHLTASSIAKKTNEIWEDIDKWWLSNRTQKVRILFCNQFAKLSKNPAEDLKKKLLNYI